jgi:hypothetical protein
MNLLLCPVFLVAGLVEDWFITRYYLCVSSGRRVPAASLSFVISLYNFGISLFLIMNKDWASAACLAVGTAAGTWLAMGRPPVLKKKAKTSQSTKNRGNG